MCASCVHLKENPKFSKMVLGGPVDGYLLKAETNNAVFLIIVPVRFFETRYQNMSVRVSRNRDMVQTIDSDRYCGKLLKGRVHPTIIVVCKITYHSYKSPENDALIEDRGTRDSCRAFCDSKL